MANAKKCDRCGAFYEITVENRDPDLKVVMHVKGVVCNADLCDRCRGKLKEFIKGRDLT